MTWGKLGTANSEANRMNRIVPQTSDLSRDPENTFTFRVKSEFPFFIVSGNIATITSGFTVGEV